LNAKGGWEQEFVAVEHAKPKEQIEPRRDMENRGVRDKIYCKDAIEDAGHLSSSSKPLGCLQLSTLN